ncbi:MAG: ATP-binding protein [Bacteroidota bacterium]
MTRETLIDKAIREVRSMRDYKRLIALRAAVDTRVVDTLIDQRQSDVIDAILSLVGYGTKIRIVDTMPKKFIEKVILSAAWDQRFYIVFGPPGVGKTITADYSVTAVREKNPIPIGCVRVTEMNKSNLRYFYRDLAHALAVKDISGKKESVMSWRGYITYRNLKDQFAGNRGVIVIDEAHRLRDNMFDGIRDLMDETQLSIVMLGATEFSQRLDQQFLRRIAANGDRYVIPEATAGDVRIFCAAYGVEIDADESRAIARKIKNKGSIGTLNAAFRIITKQVRDDEFTWQHVGAGQIMQAIDRAITEMKVRDDQSDNQ